MLRILVLIALLPSLAFSPGTKSSREELEICKGLKFITDKLKEDAYSALKGHMIETERYDCKVDLVMLTNEEIRESDSEIAFIAEYNHTEIKNLETTFARIRDQISKCFNKKADEMDHDDGKSADFELDGGILIELELFADPAEEDNWIDIMVSKSK